MRCNALHSFALLQRVANLISFLLRSLKPEDFGMSRYIDIGSRLTGWNAVRSLALLSLRLAAQSIQT